LHFLSEFPGLFSAYSMKALIILPVFMNSSDLSIKSWRDDEVLPTRFTMKGCVAIPCQGKLTRSHFVLSVHRKPLSIELGHEIL
jgi:hypothetical protein